MHHSIQTFCFKFLVAKTSWISASRQVNSALFFLTLVIFTILFFFHCGMPPLCPGIGSHNANFGGGGGGGPRLKKLSGAWRRSLCPQTSKPCRRLWLLKQETGKLYRFGNTQHTASVSLCVVAYTGATVSSRHIRNELVGGAPPTSTLLLF